MNITLSKILTALLITLIAYLGLSLVSSVTQLALLTDKAIPGAGEFIFWSLIAFFLVLIVTSIVIYLRMPKALIPPKSGSDKELSAYRRDVVNQLRKNPLLVGVPLDTDENLNEALKLLGELAESIIKNTSSAVFVSTAVMQNGRLDGLIVFASQMRMLWRIAKIYYVRPSPKQILYIYSNVGTNILIADSIQEINFAEITTPVVVSVIPSIKGGIPGLQGISSLLVNSMANGAANAFLTLRIGLLAKSYSEALHRLENSTLRQSVTLSALSMVATIVKEQGVNIVKKSWETVRSTMVDAAEATIESAKEVVSSAIDKTVDGAQSISEKISGTWSTIKK